MDFVSILSRVIVSAFLSPPKKNGTFPSKQDTFPTYSRHKLELYKTMMNSFALALQNNQPAVARLILELDPSLHLPATVDSDGDTALHLCAYFGMPDVAQILLEQSVESVAVRNKKGKTPLGWAVIRGHTGMVRLLFAAGADFAVQNLSGNEPILNVAAHKGHEELMLALLDEYGLNPNMEDENNGLRPLACACDKGNVTIIRMLCERGADLYHVASCRKFDVMIGAACEGNTDVIRALQAHTDWSVNATDEKTGMTMLHIAVNNDHPETCRFLLDQPGLEINAPSPRHHKGTALMNAVNRRNWQIAAMLRFDERVDLEAVDEKGNTYRQINEIISGWVIS